MSWAAHNPELYEELTTEALPWLWRTWVENELIDLYDVPDYIRDKASLRGMESYFSGLADGLESRMPQDYEQ